MDLGCPCSSPEISLDLLGYSNKSILISGIWVVRAAARKSLVNNLHVQPSGKRQTYSMLGCNNLKKNSFSFDTNYIC